MTCRDFRLLVGRVTLAAPLGAAARAEGAPEQPAVHLAPTVAR